MLGHRITLTLAASISVVSGLWAGGHAVARTEQSVLRDQTIGFKLTVPEGWRLTRQTGFPALLARLSWSAAPAAKVRILLSSGALPPGGGLGAYVARNNRALTSAVSVKVAESRPVRLAKREAWQVTARAEDGQQTLRQLYLKHRRKVLVLTLHCPSPQLSKAAEELARVVEAIAFD